MILSKPPAVPVKRTTATIVRPPLVAIFKLRGPALRYCNLVRSKVMCPWPCGPPSALYTGRMADPGEGARSSVDRDENEGLDATRARNLVQVLEFKKHPVDALYLPATHAMQTLPSGPVHPLLQVQFVKAALPAGEFESDGQVLHVELSEAPSAVEYVPAPQLVHRAAPVAGEYVPAPQSVHAAGPVDALYFPATHGVHRPP